MKILLISPMLAKYYEDIVQEIIDRGDSVTWYYDSLRINSLQRLLKKFFRKTFDKKYTVYIQQIISKHKNEKIDVICLINGGLYFKEKHFDLLKEAFPNSKFIYYTWDSIKNYPNVLSFVYRFDKKLSFDPNDCDKYSLDFLPLFSVAKKIDRDIQYDYCSIMTYDKNKHYVYTMIHNLLSSNFNGYKYLYIGNCFSYWFNKLFVTSGNKGVLKKFFHNKKMSKTDAYNYMCSSKAIVDCPREGQDGLTIRTFEALSLNRKLITTNKNIKRYDFYNPNNIFVVDENTNEIPTKFFESPFQESKSFNNVYSLKSFVTSLIYDYDPKKYVLKGEINDERS